MSSLPVSLAVLVSGEGSNLQALIDHQDPAFTIAVVISDRPGVGALVRAHGAGIPTEIVDWASFGSRDAFTTEVCNAAQGHGAGGMILAGFMRILAPVAMKRFPDAIINVHPALLPSFPGADAVEQALAAGVTYTGVTVHFVDEQVDHGPIIAQRPVPVHDGDDPATLHQRIQEVEHELYPEVVAAFARGELDSDGANAQWQARAASGGPP